MRYAPSCEDKRIFRQIASFYGCRVRFKSFPGGRFFGEYIEIGYSKNRNRLFRVFCHELGHFINWKSNRYPLYHNPRYFGKLNSKFRHYNQLVRYALNAEILTEGVGADLMRQWFPNMKYVPYYKNTKLCYEFLYGYYLRG